VLILIAGLVLLFALAVVLLWRKRRRQSAEDVIYLGYDDQDGVSSMHSALLERVRKGDLGQ
jgi:hypothetical protein